VRKHQVANWQRVINLGSERNRLLFCAGVGVVLALPMLLIPEARPYWFIVVLGGLAIGGVAGVILAVADRSKTGRRAVEFVTASSVSPRRRLQLWMWVVMGFAILLIPAFIGLAVIVIRGH